MAHKEGKIGSHEEVGLREIGEVVVGEVRNLPVETGHVGRMPPPQSQLRLIWRQAAPRKTRPRVAAGGEGREDGGVPGSRGVIAVVGLGLRLALRGRSAGTSPRHRLTRQKTTPRWMPVLLRLFPASPSQQKRRWPIRAMGSGHSGD